MSKSWQQMRQAREEFWAHHPQLWDDRGKIELLYWRRPDGSPWAVTYRWKTAADRRYDRREWLERRLFCCVCPSCPDHSRWGKLLLKITRKLRIT